MVKNPELLALDAFKLVPGWQTLPSEGRVSIHNQFQKANDPTANVDKGALSPEVLDSLAEAMAEHHRCERDVGENK